jgi:hypothetical protein
MAQPRTANGPGKRSRVYRSGPQEREPDLQTAIEDEMAASGHHSVVPRTGVIGAHSERVTSSTSPSIDDAMTLPPGVDVAPTRKALEREQERHQAARSGEYTAVEPGAPAPAPSTMPAAPQWPEAPRGPSLPARLLARGRDTARAVEGVVDLVTGLTRFGASRAYALVRSRLGRHKAA